MLIFDGNMLEDSKLVKDYSIQSGSIINLFWMEIIDEVALNFQK